MSEMSLQIIASCKLLWVIVFSLLYGLGGMKGKWKRRFIGPIWIVTGIFLFSKWVGTWNPLFLIYLPLLIGALCLGYGGNKFFEKIKRRAIFGSAIGFSAIPLAIWGGNWKLWLFHISLCLVMSIVLGVFNITGNARNEESLIGFTAVLLPMFMI